MSLEAAFPMNFQKEFSGDLWEIVKAMDQHVIGGRRDDIEQVSKGEKPSMETAKGFLRHTQVSTLYPEDHGTIIKVDASDSASHAFQVLFRNFIFLISDFDHQEHSLRSSLEFKGRSIRWICGHVGFVGYCYRPLQRYRIVWKGPHAICRNERENETTNLWRDRWYSFFFIPQKDLSKRNRYYPVQSNASILDALHVMNAHKVHRIPIVSSEGELITLVTQSHLIRLIHANINKFAIGNKRVSDLQLGYKDVLSLTDVSSHSVSIQKNNSNTNPNRVKKQLKLSL